MPTCYSQDGVGAEKVSAVTLNAIMDTINSLRVKLEDNFKSLREKMEMFKCELKVDLDKLESTVVELEKSSTVLSQQNDKLEKSNTSYIAQMSLQQMEIEDLKKQLANKKERVLHLEEYSRRENLKFRNIPELPEEDCKGLLLDIISKDLMVWKLGKCVSTLFTG